MLDAALREIVALSKLIEQGAADNIIKREYQII